MRPMIYSNSEHCLILDAGYFEGYLYMIVSYGSHPCAYVRLTRDHYFHGVPIDYIPVDCHGGLTYDGGFGDACLLHDAIDKEVLNSGFYDLFKSIIDKEIYEQFWIGWDYMHSGDYVSLDDDSTSKKWTTEEILEEVKYVIEQLKEVNKV